MWQDSPWKIWNSEVTLPHSAPVTARDIQYTKFTKYYDRQRSDDSADFFAVLCRCPDPRKKQNLVFLFLRMVSVSSGWYISTVYSFSEANSQAPSLQLLFWALNHLFVQLSNEVFFAVGAFPFFLSILVAELKCIRSKEEDGMGYAQDLAKSHRYSLQLERQLRELLQSPQGSGQLIYFHFVFSFSEYLIS